MIDQIAISWLKSKHDSLPKRATLAWSQLVTAFSKIRRAPCSKDTCKHNECPHKNGKSWSPATYPAGSARQKKLVDEISLLVVDLDHLTEEEFTQAHAKLAPHQHIIHASHSDRPASLTVRCVCGSSPGALHGAACPARVDRCLRAVIALSRSVKRDEWPRFWHTAMIELGQPADPSCCDANRLYYLPSRPADADYFFATNDGIVLNVEEILAKAPVEVPSIAVDLHLDGDGIVEPGKRHAMLKSIAGALRFRGAGAAEIEAALHIANKRCSPPKPAEEIEALAKWAADQPASTLPQPEPDPRRQRPVDSELQLSGPSDEEAEDFLRNEDGEIFPSQDNIDLALRKLGVKLRYNEFSQHEIIEGLAGFGPRLDDGAVNRLRFTIDSQYGFLVPKLLFFDLVSDRARLHRFHPVRGYLDNLTWDGMPRIDRWLIDLAGAKDTPYVRAVSRIALVAAVRRVRHPGSKYDEMLILESEQGTNKSTGLRALAVDDDWFSDDLPLGGDTKRFMEATAGKWIVEAGELKGMGRSDIAALKACLSRQIDEARLSYDRKPSVSARQFIIIGTTNETEGYLRDPTGNRRFWPVRIKKIELQQLRQDRDQLWAEASVAEARGDSIRMDPSLYEEAGLEQDARMRNEDPMADALHYNLGKITGKLRIADAYLVAGIEPGKATQDQMTRLGQAIRDLGWERERRRFAGERCYTYVRGTEQEREVELYVEHDPMTRVVKVWPRKPGSQDEHRINN